MRVFESFPPSRRWLALFLVLTVAPAAGLVWLGWRLLEQDRALEAQRALERQEHAADLIAGALSRQIAGSRQLLAQPRDSSSLFRAPDAVLVTIQKDSISDIPAGRLLYYPVLPEAPEAPEAPFRAAEILEFSDRDYTGAIEQFRAFAHSSDPAVCAGAHLRIARNQRKSGDLQQALATYDQLARFRGIRFSDAPAELTARNARCVLLEEMGKAEDLEREAQALYEDLLSGRFRLTQPVFQLHAEQVRRWIPLSRAADADRLALSDAVEGLWQVWQEARSGTGSVPDMTSVRMLDRSLTILSDTAPDRLTALIAGPRYAESEWLSPVMQTIPAGRLSVSLRDADGNPVNAPPVVVPSRQSVRMASDTGLPWTVVIASAASGTEPESLTSRRRLLLAGLALAAVLVITTGYALARSLSRELDIARLKSEFVAAVSHEFRTPLATLRQLTENLTDGRVSTDERRSDYYKAQARATNRLTRLVERLLDFGRMEAGALRYQPEPVDLGRLVRDVVDEFEHVAATSRHEIVVTVDPALPELRADPEALGQALWNLIDNAIKYSPGRPAIWVDAAREGEFATIRVRDEGPGISREEQRQLFRKFFRGSAAGRTHVKGTGIGLAMVDYIVRGHRGRIRVESQPGKGSTFTILLKLEAP